MAVIVREEGEHIGHLLRVGVRAVGVERSILTSDLGQPENPIHTSGLVTFFEQLRQRGFTEAEIRRMSRENPARFLGLP